MNEQEAAWLARTQEEPIDPEQEICDPHHHLWDYPESRYMLEELHGDTGAGHNVTSTVFVECASGYREDGPGGDARRRRDGVRAGSGRAQRRRGRFDRRHRQPREHASGRPRKGRARSPYRGRRRPLPRHPPLRRLRPQPGHPGLALQAAAEHAAPFRLPARVRLPGAARSLLRRLALPPADRRADGSRPRLPGYADHSRPRGRASRHRAIQGPPPRGRGGLAQVDRRSSPTARTSSSSSAGCR